MAIVFNVLLYLFLEFDKHHVLIGSGVSDDSQTVDVCSVHTHSGGYWVTYQYIYSLYCAAYFAGERKTSISDSCM